MTLPAPMTLTLRWNQLCHVCTASSFGELKLDRIAFGDVDLGNFIINSFNKLIKYLEQLLF